MTDLPRPYLNQGDPAWRSLKAGRSRSRTIGQVGCVLTCYAQAMRIMGIDAEATPASVQRRALELWDGSEETAPFAGNTAAAFQVRLAAANGLTVGDRVNIIDGQRLWGELIGSFFYEGLCLMHVDSIDDGRDDANHWVLGVRLDGQGDDAVVVYADPDGGYEGRLPLRTLQAPSPKGKPYAVQGVRRIRRRQ